ncbi:Translation initiation factor 3 subunit b [Mitosporidium daphniae]|uniref:Eukaryotic translation initiation factor 3 subunit B n=1 Tax=Mitosporidium daphniae TaxID=1485682 RepID=A0A098VLZ3_9MICR|nr:subunit B of eukaryotic translation initiation factor 3 [Mitosporidium daphniae]KGG49945.1 subunit B of eukaryotic translation initiation factor 3 [Mitosporidium daphniae]|eukprot:XP_013236372.1 subunit B of eukaryotic translation initiation factor 3 [Mitosporidium daphniae]
MISPGNQFTLEELGIDFTDLEEEYSIAPDLSTDHILLLDQIPKFEPAKEKAFITLLKTKLIGSFGTIRENGIYIPKDPETGNCKGFLFVELEDATQAKNVQQALHGRVLDKNHTILVLPFSELASIASTPITEFKFTPEPFTEKGHLKSWLCDERARDQFLAHHSDSISIFWNEGAHQDERVFSQSNISDRLQWSTTGIYLASFHQQGIMISGGPTFQPINRFSHPGVFAVEFSKADKFMVTYSAKPIAGLNSNVVIWDLSTGMFVKTFLFENLSEPNVKWSHDDKYAAFVGKNEVFLMNSTDSFNFVNGGNQSLGLPAISVVDIAFSPSKNLLAYWSMEYENTPAKVAVLEIPTFRLLRIKNLFNISHCNLYWHAESTYFAVSVDRSKGKKSSSIEIFRLNEKDVSVEFLELNGLLTSFSWEMTGDRFATIENDSGKLIINFYNMKKPLKSKDFTVTSRYEMGLIKSFEKRSIGSVLWNPKGRFFVFCGLENMAGMLEFYSINDKEEFELLSSIENFNATHAEWDPSGRFFATFQLHYLCKSDNNYTIWDFRGQTLRRQPMDVLKNFSWRPRPKILLSPEKVKDIKKNLKSYSAIFDQEDQANIVSTQQNQEKSKQNLVADWIAWKKAARADWCNILNDPNLFNTKKELSASTTVSEWVEEVLEETDEYFN